MTEIWKAIEGFPPYEVSNLGRVRRPKIEVICGKNRQHKRIVPERITAGHLMVSNGYCQVMLPGRNKRSIHRLVAAAFCAGYKPDLVVNHKNGIRHDNRAENLEWVTCGENLRHSFEKLGRKGSCVGKFGSKHPASKKICAENTKTGERREFSSGLEAAKWNKNFTSWGISRCCTGETKTHRGYRFWFVQP
jgi:hypothetical protein